jgi:signal transduction histidine kinase
LSLVAAVARLHGGDMLIEDNAPGLQVVLVLPPSVIVDPGEEAVASWAQLQ